MHCRELVELAAAIAVRGPAPMGDGCPSDDDLEQYRSASQERVNRWTTALNAPRQFAPGDARPLLEEILVTEILTRVWAGAAYAGEDGRLQSIAHSAFAAHLSARNLALRMLLDGRGMSSREVIGLNRIRRRSEHWTDLLLGYLVLPREDRPQKFVHQGFAFEPERAEEFARDLAEDHHADSLLAGQILRSSLQAAFREGLSEECPSADLNRAIANATIRCFACEPSNPLHASQGPWLRRLTHAADNAESLITELLSLHR